MTLGSISNPVFDFPVIFGRLGASQNVSKQSMVTADQTMKDWCAIMTWDSEEPDEPQFLSTSSSTTSPIEVRTEDLRARAKSRTFCQQAHGDCMTILVFQADK
jgi:hypothetical protein